MKLKFFSFRPKLQVPVTVELMSNWLRNEQEQNPEAIPETHEVDLTNITQGTPDDKLVNALTIYLGLHSAYQWFKQNL